MATLRDNQVIIQFAANISGDAQAKSMLAMEKHLRQITGQEIQVFKEAMGDDSRLRASMTAAQRAKL
ncbi:MAG TPA: hypothetical protein VN742_12255 [Candidatus Binataceae bacterium]|nr:hypothetical protein [Candidatus Binataceae bacterium]